MSGSIPIVGVDSVGGIVGVAAVAMLNGKDILAEWFRCFKPFGQYRKNSSPFFLQYFIWMYVWMYMSM